MIFRPARAALYNSIAKFVLATAFFVALDGVAKYMIGSVPPLMVLWGRYTFSFLFLLMILPMLGMRLTLASRHVAVQLCRSFLLLGVTLCMFLALRVVPMAFAYALFYASPLFVLLSAVAFSDEKLSSRQLIGALLGFTGVLFVIRPSWSSWQWATLLPLLAAGLYACYQVLTRYVARSDSTLSSLLYLTVGGTVATSLALPWVFVTMSLTNWLLLMLLGVLGTVGHALLISAYKSASASVLSPFVYVQIVWAGLIDIFVFNTSFDPLDALGAAIVIVAGLCILSGVAKQSQTDIDSI